MRRCGKPRWNGAGLEVESRNCSAEARTRAARRPEQIRVALRVCSDQLAVCGHDVDRRDLLGCVTPAAEAHAHPALEQKTTKADGGTVGGADKAAIPRQPGIELAARDGWRDADDAGALIESGLLEAAEIHH